MCRFFGRKRKHDRVRGLDLVRASQSLRESEGAWADTEEILRQISTYIGLGLACLLEPALADRVCHRLTFQEFTQQYDDFKDMPSAIESPSVYLARGPRHIFRTEIGDYNGKPDRRVALVKRD